jgi:hypothetical protein
MAGTDAQVSTEQELPENIADAPIIEHPSATKPPRKSPGRPFTKENAKTMQISAARAKKARKEARAQMLMALTTKLDLGDEIVKAWQMADEKQMNLIEKALRIVGLHHDQSPDAQAQKFQVNANANVKKDSTVKLVIEDFTKPEE